MRLAIIGSGDLAQQIFHYATTDLNLSVIGFFDDYLKKETLINKKPILGGINDVLKLFKENKFDALIVGIGYKFFNFRSQVFQLFQGIVPFANLVHTTCIVDPSAKIGEGVVIFPGSIIDMNVNIADNVLINIGCVIAHDSSINSHSFLSPSVKIAGFVSIGKTCNIGINTTIVDNIKIMDSVRTGGGTVIIKNINKPGLYVGNPQRFIR